MTAGYSGTPLPTKLGIKAGSRVLLIAAPTGFSLGAIPPDATVHTRRGSAPYDVIVAFTPKHRALVMRFESLMTVLTSAGGLWICWPKKASGMQTDLGEGGVREHGLDCGLVDVKIAAIDDTWSGIKFVRRLADR